MKKNIKALESLNKHLSKKLNESPMDRFQPNDEDPASDVSLQLGNGKELKDPHMYKLGQMYLRKLLVKNGVQAVKREKVMKSINDLLANAIDGDYNTTNANQIDKFIGNKLQ